MGVIRFQVHPENLLDDWPEVHQAYVSGLDNRVYPTRIEVDGNVIACRRQSAESGKFHVAWPVPEFGRPIISTSTLLEREKIYLLPVELARGKICQVRNQLSNWERLGMKIPHDFHGLHQESHRLLAKATSMQDEPQTASDLANQAIAKSCEAAEILTCSYTGQRLAIRHRRSFQLPVSLGCNLAHASPTSGWNDQLCHAFNAAVVPVRWRHIEPDEGDYHWELSDEQVDWCQENRLLTIGGPLLDFSPDGLPEWLQQWGRDFFNLQSFLCDFVETAITRYVGKIRIWDVSSRVNTGGALELSEENRLTLVARTIEVARHVDEEAQLLVRIDQPWGDYQARGQHRLSPSQFVDALVRCGVGLSGVNLEIGVGYRPYGTASRDVMDFSRLIDQWSTLEIPLYVTLAFPSSTGPDPKANPDLKLDSNGWKAPWSEQAQADWIDLYLPLLMAKQSVIGVFWSHLTDAEPHEFPHAGLINPDGTPKLALQQFVKHRQASPD